MKTTLTKLFRLSALSVMLCGVTSTYADNSAQSSADLAAIKSNTANMYAQLSAHYTQAIAGLYQVDQYLNGLVGRAATLVMPKSSSALEADQHLKLAATTSSSVYQASKTIAALNTSALARKVISRGNNTSDYLSWYSPQQSSFSGLLLSTSTLGELSNNYDDYTSNLTVGVPASDSIGYNMIPLQLSQTKGLPSTAKFELVKNPNNDSYFDFANFFMPLSGVYDSANLSSSSKTQITAAQAYAEYLTLNGRPLSKNVSSVINTLLAPALDAAKAKPAAIKKVNTIINGEDSPYPGYLLAERQYNVGRSMVEGLMQSFIAERAPIKNAADSVIATDPNAGKYFNLKNNKDHSASPLQIERYTRLHRVEDPQWYQRMNTASPAAIAREQLYVSAEQLAATQQAHEDSEKLLLASLLTANMSSTQVKHKIAVDADNLVSFICKTEGYKSGICKAGDRAKKMLSGLPTMPKAGVLKK